MLIPPVPIATGFPGRPSHRRLTMAEAGAGGPCTPAPSLDPDAAPPTTVDEAPQSVCSGETGAITAVEQPGGPPEEVTTQRLVRDLFSVGEPDGRIGPRTTSALREFQQQNGLPASGRLDQATLSALHVSDSRN